MNPLVEGSARRLASTYTTQHRKTQAYILASTGIRIRNASVRVAQDHARLCVLYVSPMSIDFITLIVCGLASNILTSSRCRNEHHKEERNGWRLLKAVGTKYMLMPRHHNTGQKLYLKADNVSFENMVKFISMLPSLGG